MLRLVAGADIIDALLLGGLSNRWFHERAVSRGLDEVRGSGRLRATISSGWVRVRMCAGGRGHRRGVVRQVLKG